MVENEDLDCKEGSDKKEMTLITRKTSVKGC